MSAIAAYIVINVDPILLRLGPLTVRWYGLMYAVGLGLALWVTAPIAERRGTPREVIYTIFWSVTIAGLIGGRLYYVVQNDPLAYLSHPERILALWEGGMAFYGAIFLGVPALYLLARLHRVPFLPLLDTVAIFAPLAQAVGRIGNIINGDIVGYPSTLPWATAYANPGAFVRPLCRPPYTGCTAFQPAAAYELLFSLGLFAVMWQLRRRNWPAGLQFVLYLALYSIGQLVIFTWRDNVLVLGPLKQAQVTALVVLAALVPIALYVLEAGRGRLTARDQGYGDRHESQAGEAAGG
ncbi:MAG TPA: prolipoprotein diacylglyceryl transferase [Chloroflexota bacterium]|nr:prolipoprotein diacylglyceryl transferase [Chloroflexota bacterium]